MGCLERAVCPDGGEAHGDHASRVHEQGFRSPQPECQVNKDNMHVHRSEVDKK